MSCKIVVGMPVYNEASALPKLFVKLERLYIKLGDSLHLVFVDDGSTDQTRTLLSGFTGKFPGACLLVHEANRGLGEAMNTMFGHMVRHYEDRDILVTLDADNTHDPNLIMAMVRKLKNEQLDLVVASRFAPGGRELGLPLLRKLYSRGARLFFRLIFPIAGVNDYSSGFRAYTAGIIRKAIREYHGRLITLSGFACTAEIIAKLGRVGVKAGEVPLTLEYFLKEGRSKMNVKQTVAGYFRLVRAVRLPSAETGPEFTGVPEQGGEQRT